MKDAHARTRESKRHSGDCPSQSDKVPTYQELLDEALDETFPASDPISPTAAMHASHRIESARDEVDWALRPGGHRPPPLTCEGQGGLLTQALAQEALDRLKPMLEAAQDNPGLSRPRIDYEPTSPRLSVQIDRDKAASLGISAQSIGRAAGVPVQLEEGLRERHFGELEGLTHDEIHTRWPDQARRWKQRDPAFGPVGGETLTEFYQRSVGHLTRLAQRHLGQTIVVVAHGGVLDCFYRAANGIDLTAPRSWTIGNATINRLLYSPDGLTMIGWADDGHLVAHGGALDESSDGALAPA